MKHRIIGLFVLGMFLTFSGMSCGGGGGGGGKKGGYFMGPIGIIAIVNMDTDMDGVPNDTYAYMIMIRDDTANNMVADPPVVTMPDGSTLPTYCAMGGNETACSTVIQIPPGGSKTDVPTGDYSIANNGGLIVAFRVLADDLLNLDPAYADIATLVPSSPGVLGDPAVLSWGVTPGGVDGDIWEFGIENADGDDDDGEYIGNEWDWADSVFSLNLPDNWDNNDALAIEIISQRRNEMDGYYQGMMVQIVVTGYTLNKP